MEGKGKEFVWMGVKWRGRKKSRRGGDEEDNERIWWLGIWRRWWIILKKLWEKREREVYRKFYIIFLEKKIGINYF